MMCGETGGKKKINARPSQVSPNLFIVTRCTGVNHGVKCSINQARSSGGQNIPALSRRLRLCPH